MSLSLFGVRPAADMIACPRRADACLTTSGVCLGEVGCARCSLTKRLTVRQFRFTHDVMLLSRSGPSVFGFVIIDRYRDTCAAQGSPIRLNGGQTDTCKQTYYERMSR